MKLAGMIVIITAAGSVGFRISAQLKSKCRLLETLLRLLGMMKQEICVYATPLAQVFGLLATASDGILERVFSATAKEMNRQPWSTPHRAMTQALEHEREELLNQVLLPLCMQLGKYDWDAQRLAVEAAEQQTLALLHQLEQERSLKSKTYQTLGICAGLAVSVLLL